MEARISTKDPPGILNPPPLSSTSEKPPNLNFAKAINLTKPKPINPRSGDPTVKSRITNHNGMPTVIFKSKEYYGVMAMECKFTLIKKSIEIDGGSNVATKMDDFKPEEDSLIAPVWVLLSGQQGNQITFTRDNIKDMSVQLIVDLGPFNINHVQDNFNEMNIDSWVEESQEEKEADSTLGKTIDPLDPIDREFQNITDKHNLSPRGMKVVKQKKRNGQTSSNSHTNCPHGKPGTKKPTSNNVV
ncbi:hypothetical protein HAX54_009659 [Datura stramonium]|uniref:DUF4283 domain-containing protein n=1 Tax=Datura stramonium TaxID=4076 RepID=A0ABS8TF61_DATST|nr:hypothetical protein [Datura stramonium]